MERAKQRYKYILALAILLFFACSIIFAGCAMQYHTINIIDANYDIDRIIYTNKVNKYINGKRFLTGVVEFKPDESTTYSLDCDKSRQEDGIYLCINDDCSIDIVLDTTKTIEDTGWSLMKSNNIWEVTDYLYFLIECFMGVRVESNPENNPILNSHKYLFSDRTQAIFNNYQIVKTGNDECTCGIKQCELDFGSNNYYCGCYEQGPYIKYEGRFKEGDSLSSGEFHVADVPLCCYDVVEDIVQETENVTAQVYIRKQIYKNTSNEEVVGSSVEEYVYNGNIIGTGNETQIDTTGMEFVREDRVSSGNKTVSYTHDVTYYDVTHACSCHVGAEYSAPSVTDLKCPRNEEVIGGFPLSMPNFNELIIDGFDLTEIDGVIEETINSMKTKSAWEEFEYEKLLDLNNYSHMFENMPCKQISLNNITGIKYEIQDLSYMFANCKNLQYVDFGNFFENVTPTDISYMFYNCPNLQYVNLTGLDTSKVTNMENMFSNYGQTREEFLDCEMGGFIGILNMAENLGIPTTNNGEPWTFNDFVLYVISQDEELNEQYTLEPEKTLKLIRAELGQIMITSSIGTDQLPVSYDEFIILNTNGEYLNEAEFLEAVNADPTQFGLTVKEDGTPYSIEEIEVWIQSQILSNEDLKSLQVTKAEYLDELCAYMQGYKTFNNDVEEINFLLKNSGRVNNVLNDMSIPYTNNGESWTLETLTEYIIQNDESLAEFGDKAQDIIKIEIKFILVEMGYNVKFDYTEVAILISDANPEVNSFEDLVELVNADPTQFGLTVKEDGTLYTEQELKNIFKTKLAEDGIIVYSDAELEEMASGEKKYYKYEYVTTTRTREELINENINSKLVPYLIENGLSISKTNNGEPWTWDTITMSVLEKEMETDEELKQSYLENPQKVINFNKTSLGLQMIMEYNLTSIPLLYTEVICFLTGGELTTIEELIDLLNADNPKEDNTSYTKSEVIEILQSELTSAGLTNQLIETDEGFVITEAEVVKKIYSSETILILGGENSKFNITNSMNTNGMLINNTFSKIVVPTIEEGVTIELSNNYFSDNQNKTQLTSLDSNKTFTMGYYEPPKTDEEDNGNANGSSNENTNKNSQKTLKIVLAISIPLLVVIAIATTCIIIYVKKRNSNSVNNK